MVLCQRAAQPVEHAALSFIDRFLRQVRKLPLPCARRIFASHRSFLELLRSRATAFS